MTIITNVHGLPQAIVDAIINDPYTGGGDISCTRLIDAPQIDVLFRQHYETLTEDASERVWSLLGQAVHTILERAALRNQGATAEERLYATVDGWEVSGQYDTLDLIYRRLTDYKVTTTYNKNGTEKWVHQLNVLRWLAHQNGHEITQLEIVAIFRDWRKIKAQTDPNYPQAPIARIAIPLWDLADTEEYIHERVRLHKAAREGWDSGCTDDERWYTGDTYALMKKGGKRAVKLAPNEADLGEVNPATHHVVFRPGEYKRCAHYCSVAQVCPQWAETIRQSGGVVQSNDNGDE